MEIVMLFRLLLSSEGPLARNCARKIIDQVFEGTYQVEEKKEGLQKSSGGSKGEATPGTPEVSEEADTHSTELLAVFAILGGLRDVVRVGGKVGLPSKYGADGVVQGMWRRVEDGAEGRWMERWEEGRRRWGEKEEGGKEGGREGRREGEKEGRREGGRRKEEGGRRC
jgi:hypothetical protein